MFRLFLLFLVQFPLRMNLAGGVGPGTSVCPIDPLGLTARADAE